MCVVLENCRKNEKIIDSVGEYEITENKNKAHAADSINDLSQKCALSA